MTDAAIKFFSPDDIATRYSVKASKVLAWINSGELRAVNITTRRGVKPRWKIDPITLAAFENSRASKPSPKTPVTRQRRKAEPGETVFFT